MILDKKFNEEKISKLVSDVNEFKKLNEDFTLIREVWQLGFHEKLKLKFI